MLEKLTIKNKLTLIMTLVTSVTLMFGFAGITLSYYNENKSSLIEGMQKEAKLVASYSQVPVALNFHEDLKRILIPTPSGVQVPLGELAAINYTRGPQLIKSENTFFIFNCTSKCTFYVTK